jgi:beta-lactamase class A
LHFEETGRLTLDKEDERALADMIQHSSNEATVYLLGRLTQTENGALLNEADLDRWWHQRQGVDRFFKTLNLKGYESCQLFHGTYEFSPYGRENQVRQFGRNLLSPLACNQLMIALLRSEILGEASLKKCWTLLNRDWERALPEQVLEESQVKSFMAEGVSSQTRIWSKAGWTSETRHDCAVFRKGTGTLVVTVMSRGKGLATNSQWLPRFGGFLSGQFFS